jgi:integrase
LPLRNPVSKVNFCDEDNEQTRVLTYDEQELYLAAATPTLRDIATLMLQTGMRPEEVYRIERPNVHLRESYLFVPFGKTKAARRRVPLSLAAIAVLRNRMAGEHSPFLLPCETDPAKPIPKVNNAHDRAVRDSKVAAFRLYDCRHTFASRAAMAGVDLVTLAALLGHSRIQMVLRYAHPTQEHQKQAMQKLEDYTSGQSIIRAGKASGLASRTVQ